MIQLAQILQILTKTLDLATKTAAFAFKNYIPIGIITFPGAIYYFYANTRRMTTLHHLPTKWKGFQFTGIVTHVGDGDGCRVVHMPLFRRSYKGMDSFSIRLAGIDAPEVRFYSRPGQPFSKESRDKLRQLILGKKVQVRILEIDRYGRIVGMIFVKKGMLRSLNVNLEMVRLGMACVYRSACVSFGGLEKEFERLENEARRNKTGMWIDPKFERPQEYKKRLPV